MSRFFLAMLVFVPITLVADYFGIAPLYLFIFSALAIIPLARFLSDATEDIAAMSGAAIGGLLNATFGNAPELIIGVLALSAHLGNFEMISAVFNAIDMIPSSLIGRKIKPEAVDAIVCGLRMSQGVATIANKESVREVMARVARGEGVHDGLGPVWPRRVPGTGIVRRVGGHPETDDDAIDGREDRADRVLEVLLFVVDAEDRRDRHNVT